MVARRAWAFTGRTHAETVADPRCASPPTRLATYGQLALPLSSPPWDPLRSPPLTYLLPQTKAKVEAMAEEQPQPKKQRKRTHAQTAVGEKPAAKPAAKSTGPLGKARGHARQP